MQYWHIKYCKYIKSASEKQQNVQGHVWNHVKSRSISSPAFGRISL